MKRIIAVCLLVCWLLSFAGVGAQAISINDEIIVEDNITNVPAASVICAYMSARNKVLTSGETADLASVAVTGLVNDEIKHRELLLEDGIVIENTTYLVTGFEDLETQINVTLVESLQTTEAIESIEHTIVLYSGENNELMVASDAYYEETSGFYSASYVQEDSCEIEPYALTASSCMIRIAKSQVGYKEKATNSNLESFTANAGSGNYTKYGKWIGANGQAWCASFISWCANKAGVSTTVVPKSASTGTFRTFYLNKGRLHLSPNYTTTAYTPKIGDIIIFGTSETYATHVGIVVSVTSSNVTIVDGNYSNKVSKRTVSRTNTEIIGYGNPSYPSSTHTAGSWVNDTGYHWKECTKCSLVMNKAAHTWVDRTTYYECSVCGYTTTSIPEISSVDGSLF